MVSCQVPRAKQPWTGPSELMKQSKSFSPPFISFFQVMSPQGLFNLTKKYTYTDSLTANGINGPFYELLKYLFLKIYFYYFKNYICLCLWVQVPMKARDMISHWSWSYRCLWTAWHGCWEPLDLGPPREQHVLLPVNAETSFTPLN